MILENEDLCKSLTNYDDQVYKEKELTVTDYGCATTTQEGVTDGAGQSSHCY